MICPVCKCENAEGARVCAICGATIPEQNQSSGSPANAAAPAKGPKSPKIVLPIVAAATLLAIALISYFAVFSGNKTDGYVFLKQSVAYFYDDAYNRSTAFVNGESVGQIEGAVAYTLASDDNHVTLFVIRNEDSDTRYSAHVLNGRKIVKIKDFTILTDIQLSASGQKIAYAAYDEDEDESALYLYDIGKEETKKIDSADYISQIVLSPDGEALTYSLREGDPENGTTTHCLYNGKKRVELGEDVNPIALSTGGKYVYALSEMQGGSATLLLYNKTGSKVREIGNPVVRTIIFNRDNTELIYSADDATYISVNGEAGVLFYEEARIYPLLPTNAKPLKSYWTSAEVYFAAVDSFYGKYYKSNSPGGGIYRVKKNANDTIILASGVKSPCFLSEDASRIYYLSEDSDLKMIETAWGKNAPDKAVTIAEDVRDYVVTSDCSRVYYRGSDGLYGASGDNGDSNVLITEEVSGNLMLGRGDILYFRYGYDLYACSDGKNATMVLPDADSEIRGGDLGYLYFKSDGAVYCTTGSATPEKVLNLN